jgi:aspartate carbamoyltransferase catalytic subunit
MQRHLLEIADLSHSDIHELFEMADAGPQPESLAEATFLSSFFQESTRTRLGFMGAAARQGASILDMGSGERLRSEPAWDQQRVLAEAADIIAVRHWDATFAQGLASTGRCAVVNAGAGPMSHPTQALIDGYTLIKVLDGEVAGLRMLFLGDELQRAGVSFGELAAPLGIHVSHCQMPAEATPEQQEQAMRQVMTADIVYIQSLSRTDYGTPHLNADPYGPALPPGVVDSIVRSKALVMHALPRGAELPDELLHSPQSIVMNQVEFGMPVRSAILRWLTDASLS